MAWWNKLLSGELRSSRGAHQLPNLIQALYKITQPFLFHRDAEEAHTWAVERLKKLHDSPLTLKLLGHSLTVKDPALEVQLDCLRFPNPVGLAAGFDKAAELLPVLPYLGFGFVEIGTFTPLQQEGQPKPRLFRYKSQRALVNRMGFNNPGVRVLKNRFEDLKNRRPVPIGINLGKGRDTAPDRAFEDYSVAFDQAYPHADYIVINVSSPNTPGLRSLQTVHSLRDLLTKLFDRIRFKSRQEGTLPKPLFTKVSPDLDDESLEEIGKLCVELGSGLIATNTTTDHSALANQNPQQGGLSGAPLRSRANDVLKILYKMTQGRVPLIGVGGVFSAEDAYQKIRLGASLVQVYTGWVYEGPNLVPKINRGILKFLKRDGFTNVKQAVGTLS